jgi:hypothetical protein
MSENNSNQNDSILSIDCNIIIKQIIICIRLIINSSS